MDINLNSEQSIQLELIAMHAGKTPVQALTEAALFLLEHDVDSWEWMRRYASRSSSQEFLDKDEMDARLSLMLRR